MRVLVTPMRLRGVALMARERRSYAGIKANVMVSSAVSQELGRATNVARAEVGMPLEPDVSPPLLDSTLLSMAITGLAQSGIEYIDGCVCTQSWWCREG